MVKPSLIYDYSDSEDDPPSDLDGVGMLEYFRAKTMKLKAQRDKACAAREEADANAILGGQHIQFLQQKLNSKNKKAGSNERTLSTGTRIITSGEGRALAATKRDAQIQKKAADDANRDKQTLAEGEKLIRRTQKGRAGLIFTGNINTLKLSPLQDLVWSLQLDESGKREDLINRVNAHFGLDDNANLKEDPCYVDVGNMLPSFPAPPLLPDAPYRIPARWSPPDMLVDQPPPGPSLLGVDPVQPEAGPSCPAVKHQRTARS
ncbi:hypothetical protein B0H10DRAFT_1941660 [Mycena sp. CBHHK59/15]|nr:hypothetical protein B0H10DRAFT_1941660 [Mycena sp. CBHHK59/15]